MNITFKGVHFIFCVKIVSVWKIKGLKMQKNLETRDK